MVGTKLNRRMERAKEVLFLINTGGSVVLSSLLDSLSFHKALPFLVNSSTIATDFTQVQYPSSSLPPIPLTCLQCILANGFLLLGSLFFFHRGIIPFTNYLRNEIESEIPPNDYQTLLSLTDFSIWSFYHTLWIFPIWIICYLSSLGWYQSIASSSYQLQHGMPKARPLKQTIIQTIYGTLVWLLTYLQAMAFYKLIPFLIQLAISFVDFSLGQSPDSSSFFLFTFIRYTLTGPLLLISSLSTFLGFLMVSILYGWYPYDMIWLSNPSSTSGSASTSSSLNHFFNRVEVYWLYFLGYGLPYALLFRYSSFFVGYGVYLMVFPLSIMMSCVSDFHYRTSMGRNKNDLPPFRIFRWSQYGANALLRLINKYIMSNQKQQQQELRNRKVK